MPIFWRVLVSVSLLVVVLYQVDWREASGAIARIDWMWLVAALLAFNVSTVLAAYRWRLIVAGGGKHGANVAARESVSATYAALWLSNFLPTAFGGDVARVMTARQYGATWAWAVSSSVFDRYFGLVTLAALFLLSESLILLHGQSGSWFLPAAVIAGVFALSLAVVAGSIAIRPPRAWLRVRWFRFVVRSMAAMRIFLQLRGCVWRVALVSVATTGFGILAYWGAATSAAPEISLSAAVAAAALGTIASAIPVSLSGWGVREGTVATVLSQTSGLSATDAGIAALLNGLVIGATSVAGMFASLDLDWSAAPDNKRAFESKARIWRGNHGR